MMARTTAFENNPAAYDAWFDANPELYQMELEAVGGFMPAGGRGLEIGAGTGRFAAPFRIAIGVEPSQGMAALAKSRGVGVIRAMAEDLPLASQTFDFVLMVTVICFLDEPGRAFREAHRVLRPGGALIIGFIDRESEIGRQYEQRKEKSRFYGEATFYSAAEITTGLLATGFTRPAFRQTLLPQGSCAQAVKEGHGRGSFVVVRATRE